MSSSSTNAVTVILPSDNEPNCTVPDAVILTTLEILPELMLTVPSVNVPPCTVPEPVTFTSPEVILPELIVTVPSVRLVPLTSFASKSATAIVKAPELEPVNDPVPILTLSSDSSQPINTLSLSPRSITKPTSFEGVPEVPVANSKIESAIVVFVELTVVVVPLTVNPPVITVSPLTVTVLAVMSFERSDP